MCLCVCVCAHDTVPHEVSAKLGVWGPEVNAPFISLRGTGHVVSWHPGVLRHAINWSVTFELSAMSGPGTCDSG